MKGEGGDAMAVLAIFEQPNLDEMAYASLRIIEVCQSEADSQRFFHENPKPNLPPGRPASIASLLRPGGSRFTQPVSFFTPVLSLG
jgi:hypothetical protein